MIKIFLGGGGGKGGFYPSNILDRTLREDAKKNSKLHTVRDSPFHAR